MRDRIIGLLKAQKAYFCNDAQTDALGKLLIMPNWTVNPQCVGQAPHEDRARWRASKCRPDTSIICAEIGGVGKKHPAVGGEAFAGAFAALRADYDTALDTCFGLLKFGGAGHTAAIYSKNDARIREYAMRMPANRVLVNTPAPQGSTGITTNVFPSMTLGCGAMAGNITSDNVGPAAPDQHQAPGVHRPQARRGVRDAAGLQQGAGQPRAAVARRRRSIATAVVAAVERYLASRGIAVSASAATPRRAVLRMLHAGSATPVQQSVVANVRRRSGRSISLAATPAGTGRRAEIRRLQLTGSAGAKTPATLPDAPPAQTGGVRLRGRRARGNQGEPQDLYRAEDDRYAVGPRPGRPL